MANLGDDALRTASRRPTDLPELIAVTAVIAARVLGLDMFDAAVPAIAWYARRGTGVHVMTVNDYLARRDAKWMGGIYEFLGLSVGCVQQGMSVTERRRAYACDITYATANEIGHTDDY